MTDQCEPCTLRGAYQECQASDCFKHEDWHARETRQRLKFLENASEEVVCATPGNLAQAVRNLREALARSQNWRSFEERGKG